RVLFRTPNYAIIGYINTGKAEHLPACKDLLQFRINELSEVIDKEHLNEIVVADSTTRMKGENLELLEKLNNLLIEGFPIKDYTQVYEDITYRVPVQHIGKDFDTFFLFSRSNQNELYRFFRRAFDLTAGIVGITLCLLLIPFVWLGNLIGNRGRLFYSQARVGKYAKP